MRQRLKNLRTTNNLSQAQVAEATGTTAAYYSQIENAERTGTLPYWLRVQQYWGLSDADLWALAKEGIVRESKG